MAERISTYRGPVTEATRPIMRPSIIRVDSSFDPESVMQCCGLSTTQKPINYEFMLQGRLFRVRQMWASVCGECNEFYVTPEVNKQINEITFRRNYPKEARIAKLIEQMQSSADPAPNPIPGV